MTPSKDGMVHISEFSPSRVNTLEDIVAVGDTVPVIVKEIRPDGRIALSIKDRDPSFFDALIKQQPKESQRKGRGGNVQRQTRRTRGRRR